MFPNARWSVVPLTSFSSEDCLCKSRGSITNNPPAFCCTASLNLSIVSSLILATTHFRVNEVLDIGCASTFTRAFRQPTKTTRQLTNWQSFKNAMSFIQLQLIPHKWQNISLECGDNRCAHKENVLARQTIPAFLLDFFAETNFVWREILNKSLWGHWNHTKI